MAQQGTDAALLKEYEQVVQQFRALTDIRFKLLAFLPLGTVGTLVVIANQKDATQIAGAFGLFGFFVTLGLFVYNLRNDQHYDELVGCAAQIERDLKLFDGSFAHRPSTWHRLIGSIKVEHRWPIHLVYVASAALWLWMSLQSIAYLGGSARIAVAVVFACFTLWFLEYSRSASGERYRSAVREGMDLLVNAPVGAEAQRRATEVGHVLALHLGGGDPAALKYEKRMRFYLQPENADEFWPSRQKTQLDVREASYVLGLTIDMPPRWVRDVYTGRRG